MTRHPLPQQVGPLEQRTHWRLCSPGRQVLQKQQTPRNLSLRSPVNLRHHDADFWVQRYMRCTDESVSHIYASHNILLFIKYIEQDFPIHIREMTGFAVTDISSVHE